MPSPVTPPSIPPSSGGQNQNTISGQAAQQAASFQQQTAATSWVDPTGVWQQFLSMSGSSATPHDVEMFMKTLLKFFSDEIFKLQDEAAKRSHERIKKAIEGNED